ncbi:MAG: YIP1 family protein [Anaerolineae bacterium]|nr:YIP1 family protein [Anaerolineae bacterium]
MIDKAIRASRLDIPVYNEVERDLNETTNALIIVVAVAIASGIGAIGQNVGVGGIIAGVLAALIGWVARAFVIYFIGTRVYNATATTGEILRTTGYAAAPGILNVLGFIPGIGGLITLVVSIWTIVTTFIATREALDLDNTKTLITIILAFLVFFAIALVLGLILGVGAAAIGIATGS